jgi:hypothetical protein
MENIGQLFRENFLTTFLPMFGGKINIYKKFNTAEQEVLQVKGMKNKEKGSSREKFEFPDRIDLKIGDIIQQANSSDFWEVNELRDYIVGDTLVHFDVYVHKFEKIDFTIGNHKTIQPHSVLQIINSPNAVIGNNLHNSVLSSGSFSSVNDNIDNLLSIIEKDREVPSNIGLEIRDCLYEIRHTLNAGVKPKSAIEKLLTLSSNISSIASLCLSLAENVMK